MMLANYDCNDNTPQMLMNCVLEGVRTKWLLVDDKKAA